MPRGSSGELNNWSTFPQSRFQQNTSPGIALLLGERVLRQGFSEFVVNKNPWCGCKKMQIPRPQTLAPPPTEPDYLWVKHIDEAWECRGSAAPRVFLMLVIGRPYFYQQIVAQSRSNTQDTTSLVDSQNLGGKLCGRRDNL